MSGELVTLRIERKPEHSPVGVWDWPGLLDCLPEHVEVIERTREYRILAADQEGINVRYTYEQARRAGIEV